MSVFRYILPAIVSGCLLGCSPKNIPFSTDNFSSASFYEALPSILDRDFRIDSVLTYETTFEEKPYEGYYVVDYSEVNAANDKNILHYKPFKGYSQKLYILKLVTEPQDSIAIYFSVQYNIFGQCVGFGPSYLGIFDDAKNLLYFYNELYTRTKRDFFSLRKSKLPLGLYMIMNRLYPRDYLNVDKIIVEKSYEIGNNVIIDVPRMFRDSSALKFTYLNAQKIN